MMKLNVSGMRMIKEINNIDKRIDENSIIITFTTHKLNLVVDSIIDSYTILFDKIYVFQNEDD